MRQQLTSGFGSGLGVTLGIGIAVFALGGGWYAYNYLSEPVQAAAPQRTIGTPEQAKVAALSALRKRGVADLAREVKAFFVPDENQWVVHGPAKTDAGKLVLVNVLLSVGTIDGKRHWKAEYVEIDGKGYLGK